MLSQNNKSLEQNGVICCGMQLRVSPAAGEAKEKVRAKKNEIAWDSKNYCPGLERDLINRKPTISV